MSDIMDMIKAKLQSQHYGPNDSQIVSTIMHPQEGALKFNQWLKDNIQQASNAPIQPNTDPHQAEQSTNASINLAGLLQTGALPFSPKSAGGTIGSIHRPMMGAVKPHISYYEYSDPAYMKKLVGDKPLAELAQTIRDVKDASHVNPDIELSNKYIDEMANIKNDSPFGTVLTHDTPLILNLDKNRSVRKRPVVFGGPKFDEHFDTGALKLPKPLYVSRESGWARGMSDAQPDNFIASAQMIDPHFPQTFANSYWDRFEKADNIIHKLDSKFTPGSNKGAPDKIYKIPEGGTVYPSQSLKMDKHEILIRQEELNKAQSMDREKFLKYVLKHGTAPFAIGGLGIKQMVDQKDRGD
jgi:hypothetical protein